MKMMCLLKDEWWTVNLLESGVNEAGEGPGDKLWGILDIILRNCAT